MGRLHVRLAATPLPSSRQRNKPKTTIRRNQHANPGARHTRHPTHVPADAVEDNRQWEGYTCDLQRHPCPQADKETNPKLPSGVTNTLTRGRATHVTLRMSQQTQSKTIGNGKATRATCSDTPALKQTKKQTQNYHPA